jgi:hypothetical protein
MKRTNILLFILVAFMLFSISNMSAYSDSITLEDYQIQYQYANAQAGDYFNLQVTLINHASSTKNLTLEIDDGNPFDLKGTSEWTVELNASANSTKTFALQVDEDAETKKYELEFNLDNGNDDWDDSFGIKIVSDSAELSLGEIVSSPKKILPGVQDVELKITISNDGEQDAENLVAKLNLPEGFISSSSYSTIVHAGNIASGSTKTLTFYFDVEENLNAEYHVFKLELDYESDGSEENSILDVEVPVFSIPQFEITQISVLSDGIHPGTKGKIKVGLKNSGGKDATDVSLKVYERSDQPFSFVEKSAYVGSLSQGQTGYAIFEFDVDKQATPSLYLLDFQVRSIDGEDVIVDDVTANLSLENKNFQIEDYLLYIAGAIVILVGGIFYLKKRKH